MIFLRILSPDEKMIESIAHQLLSEQLVIDVNIKRNIDRAELIDDKLVFSKRYMLTAKTKGLLFTTIDHRLKVWCKNNMPEVYSLPIVNMDWDQSKNLSNSVKSV